MARPPFSPLRIRALVLSAGLGLRLRPLTAQLPKPLLPVFGRPLVAHSLERLAEVGCEAVALNVHHLAAAIEKSVGAEWRGIPLTYSHEEELLGTLGALRPLRDFLAPADLILVINGDSLCRWPLRRLIRRHLRARPAATLLVSERAETARFGGGIGIGGDGVIRDFRRGATPEPHGPERQGFVRRVFAGAHVIEPRLLEAVMAGEGAGCLVRDLYEPLLAGGEVLRAVPTGVRWHDLGTPERYLLGVLEAARGRGPVRALRRNWVAPSARLARGVRLRRAVVESDARIGEGSRLEDAMVLTGARVAARSHLRRTLVAPGVELPRGARIEGRVVTPLSAGRISTADTVVGKLVYTPFA
ncbi:MAG TPA: sugar phosphate nucleotidyltransferase [Thermoanaerobaculia bacterium]|nr:sugar phosphate nucleotidyltransferase [Thermoanaerobaculia bacterium]